MDEDEKIGLTDSPWMGILPTSNELRIIFNMRNIAKRDHYGTLIAEIHYHRDELTNGQILENRPKL